MRYLRVTLAFWSTALKAELEYRTNFIMATLNSLLSVLGSIFAVSLFYQNDAELGGWRWEAALLVLGIFTFLGGLSQTLLTPNLNKIVEHVKDGTLDFVLLKPVDSQFWLSLRRFSPWGVPDILLGIGLTVYGAGQLSIDVSNIPMAVIPLGCSVLILYSLWYILATTTVWFVQIYNVTEVLRALLDAGRYPIDAFPAGMYRFVFSFVIPVAFLTTVPARALLGEMTPEHVLWSAGLAIALFSFSRFFWRFALRSYTSASS